MTYKKDMSVKGKKGLVERVNSGEIIIVAEGYLWELEKRGYAKSGAFTPEVVLAKPEVVKALHEEFVHAGSDVVLAFTYFAHREKMRVIGREDELEKLNKQALQIARQVAKDTGALLSASLCNTNRYKSDDTSTQALCESMFKEQVLWFVQGGVDFIVVETMAYFGEAMLALEAVQKYGNGTPAVVTLTTPLEDATFDGVPFDEALTRLKDAGAAVVGFNCGRGPETMLPLIKSVRQSYKGPLAALPVCFRTTPESLSYHTLRDPRDGKALYPINLSCVSSSRDDIVNFAKEAKNLGVQYIGLCCGSCSHYLRALATEYGRNPPASKYSPDMSTNTLVGNSSNVTLRDDPLAKEIRNMYEQTLT